MNTQPTYGFRARQWRRDLEDPSSHRAESAALNLGRYLLGLGQAEGVALLRRAARAEDPVTGARAAWALAEFHREAGARICAKGYLTHAENLSQSQFVPDVLLSLASRYAAWGEVERAVEVYERLLAEGSQAERELTATAAFRLADLLRERRAHVRAVGLLRRAIRDGSPSLRVHAMSELGDFLFSCWRGDVSADMPPGLPSDPNGLREAIETLYRRVVLSDHADLAPRAAFYLAELRRSAGDWIGAEADLRMVVESEHPVYAPLADEKLREAEQRTHFDRAVDQFLDDLFAPSQLSLCQVEGDAMQSRGAGDLLLGLAGEAHKPWGRFHDYARGYTSYILIIHWVGPRQASLGPYSSDQRSGEVRKRYLAIYHADASQCSFLTFGSFAWSSALLPGISWDGFGLCGGLNEFQEEALAPSEKVRSSEAWSGARARL